MSSAPEWGPLAGLIGTWEGAEGLDVSFHNVEGTIVETPFRESLTMKPFGPVENGRQVLYGLDYRTAIWRYEEENPFHTEVGYWLWDAGLGTVMRGFVIPRGQVVLAGGQAAAEDRSFTMSADLGSAVWGICSNPFLDQAAKTVRYEVTVTVGDDGTFGYDETTVLEHGRAGTYNHTDRNVLRRVD